MAKYSFLLFDWSGTMYQVITDYKNEPIPDSDDLNV